MKSHLLRLLFSALLITFFFTVPSMSQDVIHQASCTDSLILHQADSIKKVFISQGFIVVREASMQMESEFEMPVIVPLTQGTWYQFVFIGDITSKLYEVRMYDWDEKEVIYLKKQWGDIDGNVISYSYIPEQSEYHMIKPVQVNKKKKIVCGYVIMLKKVKQ